MEIHINFIHLSIGLNTNHHQIKKTGKIIKETFSNTEETQCSC